MKRFKKVNVPGISVVFYVLSALFFAYGVWTAVEYGGYVADYLNSGFYTFGRNLYNIVSSYMAAGLYFFYAAVLSACGYIIQLLKGKGQPNAEKQTNEPD